MPYATTRPFTPPAGHNRMSTPRCWTVAGLFAMAAWSGCGSGLPEFDFPPCEDAGTWTIGTGAFFSAANIVDSNATPLVGKIRVGQVLTLNLARKWGLHSNP